MKENLKKFIESFLSEQYSTYYDVQVSPIRDKKFGDYSSNVLFTLRKDLRDFDIEIFLTKLKAVKPDYIASVEIANNGFLNFTLDTQQFISSSFSSVGLVRDVGFQQRVLLEFVSANPTGPLHVGHGRGAILGDVLARILRASGYIVDCEYYVNDAGRQMDILTTSVILRYFGYELLDGMYEGEYIFEIAKSIKSSLQIDIVPEVKLQDKNPEKVIDDAISYYRSALATTYGKVSEIVLSYMMGVIRDDLKSLDVEMDSYYSECELYKSQKVEKFVDTLTKKGLGYEKEGAVWFSSSKFGDEKDRVMKRSNGSFTYFAGDIAYHIDKYERGYDLMVNIWGADHHGYVKRVKNSLKALGFDENKLVIKLLQLVSLMENGQKLSMSTRKATFVDARELVEKVGLAATRFFYLMKDGDQTMEFDLSLAVSKTSDNPIWYIQYAIARINAIERKITTQQLVDTQYTGADKDLVLKLLEFGDILAKSATSFQPHLLTNYLLEVAKAFHTYYTSARVIKGDEIDASKLAIYRASKLVLESSLKLLGIQPIGLDEEM